MLKCGGIKPGSIDLARIDLGLVSELITQPFMAAGLAFYGMGASLWIIALTRVELSYAYPMISLSYVLIFLFSWLFFHENISFTRIVGMIIILIGLFIISRS